MKINTRIWKNEFKLRESLYNFAKMLLILAIINILFFASNRQWIPIAINIVNIIPAVIIIISKLKYDKLPPSK